MVTTTCGLISPLPRLMVLRWLMMVEEVQVTGNHPAFLLKEALILTYLPTRPQTTLPSPLQPSIPFLAMSQPNSQVLWARRTSPCD